MQGVELRITVALIMCPHSYIHKDQMKAIGQACEACIRALGMLRADSRKLYMTPRQGSRSTAGT